MHAEACDISLSVALASKPDAPGQSSLGSRFSLNFGVPRGRRIAPASDSTRLATSRRLVHADSFRGAPAHELRRRPRPRGPSRASVFALELAVCFGQQGRIVQRVRSAMRHDDLMRAPLFPKLRRVLSFGRNASANPLLDENNLPGAEDWMLTRPALGREIEGYASVCSVSRGQTLDLYVNTAAPSYTIEIFRMGWYGGRGARRIYGPITARGLRQPIPSPDPETGLVDCDWQSPVTFVVGADWRSGVYLAKLEESIGHCQSYVIFVVTRRQRRRRCRIRTSGQHLSGL